jgi:PAS domain S-box-containing protein
MDARSSDEMPPGPGPDPAEPGEARAGDAWDFSAYRLRYQELFEFAADCQVTSDAKGVILEANHAATGLLHCTKEFLIGMPLGLYFAPHHRTRFYNALSKLGRHRGRDEFRARLSVRGDLRDVLVRAESYEPGARPPSVHILWQLRDETEWRRAEDSKNDLIRRLIGAEEAERRRISRELHDQMGQELAGLVLGLKALEPLIPESSPAHARLRELRETVDRIGQTTHEIAVELRPTALDDLGLQAALTDLVARWSRRSGVPVDLFCALSPRERLSPEVETAVYRIVQEAITNVARHARASRASVIVERRDGCTVIIVEDDGRGFDPALLDSSRRLGLTGMHERVNLVGGALQLETGEGSGTTIRVRIPTVGVVGG